ncbi:MAG: hypothetical protein U9Q83_12525 [Bacteroidota bacterium]|nr:hypothetical protein [Bacteroidota bacterium]
MKNILLILLSVLIGFSACKTKSFSKKQDKTIDLLYSMNFGGTEPFWAINFSKDKAIYSDYPGAEKITLSYEIKEINNENFIIDAYDKENSESFFISIKKEDCTDGMSDNTYPYSIEIKRDTRTLYGCGWKR